ncbi:ABC transporter substrate-binding protein [Deinococcus peraridilitoris]|uniref:ABC-type dipeptide transport system, periplasmic component n=1 Tax=Deinococcus peraridilitoris (strain DSM 19664 / LMG 22246 / CIP 109416 / KR-200) TaxID=937777 RepID=K9ZZ24_DEIPD|nr:ABC transporter substrate-binding protein [Deinococcus peraridilitoris]AFZ66846.1 ABC-type dipeptide transport system, periplasmic component [Deinococcus peraridilitoris DSM 19664]
MQHVKTLGLLALLSLGAAGAQTVTVGLDADPPRLDPALSSALVDRQVLNQIFDKLVDVDENLKIVPMLAKSWKITNKGLTYTFTLQPGVKFHDGNPLDAAAVKYSLERAMNIEGSARKSELSSVKEIKAVNPTTVQIDLKEPYGPLLAVLTDRAGMIVSPKAAEKAGKDFQNEPIGSGAFRYVSRKRQDNITLEANKAYWGGAPKIEKLVYRPFPDGDVRYANLLSGAAQVIYPIDPKDISKLEKNDKYEVLNIPGLGFQGIYLNLTRAPFNNKAARQAFAATIDREAIAKVVFYNTVTPATGPFPPGTPAYINTAVPKADIALAKKKLQESGKPLSFTLLTSPGAVNTQLAQLYQAMAAQAGITVKIEQVEFGTLLDRSDTKDYEALMLGWSGRPDPDGNVYDYFVTGAAKNDFGYSNKKVDELLNKARRESAMSARKTTYNVALTTVREDVPYIWVYHQSNPVGTTKTLSGLRKIPDGIMRFKDVTLK